MKENKEIKALLHLIDDPDEDVYSTVSEKIFSFGKAIIPNLETLWENSHNEELQERIEQLIHRLHFRDLTTDFTEWKTNNGPLLDGALLVAKYNYPDMLPENARQDIEKIRRNIWLELNNYLTPLEQINIINSIFFNYYKQKGVEISYDNPDYFLINKALETKKGNAISNGIIYLILCHLLDIPVKAINIPRQFILAYFDWQFEALNPAAHSSDKIKFYIDALTGQMYSHKDIENYFKRLSVPPVASYFKPKNNLQVIKFLLEEFSKCFDNDNNQYKMNELLSLANILSE
ncbi:MAG: transglutaminase family protein [Bacteroidetes bacterium]|nr:transglutaminase family protein [Bacteroidota bacterium]MBS1755662.1 transglutaminase family protein [Bacteroidota bacterium]